MTPPLLHRQMPSPLGALRLVAAPTGLAGVYLPTQPTPTSTLTESSHPTLDAATAHLEAYFEGDGARYTGPLAWSGTPFQRAVWGALMTIPWGDTRTYGWLAEAVGRPSAIRAVGAANGRNPLSILVPCHRVVGARGGLTGYAGGLAAKRWLLEHEGALQPSLSL